MYSMSFLTAAIIYKKVKGSGTIVQVKILNGMSHQNFCNQIFYHLAKFHEWHAYNSF